MEEKFDHIEKMSNGEKMLGSAAWDLERIAHSLVNVGNLVLAERLIDIADQIDSGAALMRKGYNDLFDTTIRASNQAIGNMMRGILGMAAEPNGQHDLAVEITKVKDQ